MLLLQRDLLEPDIAHEQHAPYPREQCSSVSDNDAGDGKRCDEIGDALFGVGVGVDVRGAFVEHIATRRPPLDSLVRSI